MQLRKFSQYFSTFKWCTQILENIESVPKRKEKNAIFEKAFNQSQQYGLQKQLVKFILCLHPQTSLDKETGLSTTTIYKAISTAFDIKYEIVNRINGDITELDDFDSKYFQKIDKPDNSIQFSLIYEKLNELLSQQGLGSEQTKELLIVQLLQMCSTSQEIKFLIRFLKKSMRVGLSTKSISQILGDELNSELLGFQKLSEDTQIQFGVPLLPQLAKGFKSIEIEGEYTIDFEMLTTDFFKDQPIQQFLFEYKYDGERLQVHYYNGIIKLFGRSLDDKTKNFSQLADQLKIYFDSHQIYDVIFDCEMICYKDNSIIPFQEMQNKSFQNSESLSLVCFDILKYEDENLIIKPYSKRQELYQKLLKPITKQRCVISHIISQRLRTTEQISKFLNQAFEEDLEGIMIKRDTQYTPGLRNDWLKIKKEKDADLVVLGAYYGKGKRQNWYGAFLLGAYDNQLNKFLPVTKIGTGFTDLNLQQFTEEFRPFQLDKPPDLVLPQSQLPAVWFPIKTVWEITYDIITSSPTYIIKTKQYQGGLSLRFPRYKRERPDKSPYQCFTVQEMVTEYLRKSNF